MEDLYPSAFRKDILAVIIFDHLARSGGIFFVASERFS